MSNGTTPSERPAPRRSSRPPSRPPPRMVGERSTEALTIAMAIAPGVYARNRMFDFFAKAGVKWARTRASALRGIVRQLPRATALTVRSEGAGFVLEYRVPALHLTRVVELSPAELAVLRVMCERASIPTLPASDADRTLVESTLTRLLDAPSQEKR